MNVLKNAFVIFALTLLAVPAMAQDGAVSAGVATTAAGTLGLVALAVGIMMGLAVLGGTLGQSRAASMALEGIARNPAASGKLTVPLILSLALMESLVLFAFLIGFSLQGAMTRVLGLIQ